MDGNRGRFRSTYQGEKPVADEFGNLANSTQEEWLRLEEDVEQFDYGPYGEERNMRSDELVGRACALVEGRVRGPPAQQTARMSENQQIIFNLRMQLKEEKQMRDELYNDLQRSKRMGLELCRNMMDLERRFDKYRQG